MKEKITLYDGEVEIWFDDRAHLYTHPDGTIIANPSSVNKVINKPFLPGWSARMAGEYVQNNIPPYTPLSEVDIARHARAAAKAAEEYSGDRMQIGSRIHSWADQHIQYRLGQRSTDKKIPSKKTDPQIRNGVLAFLIWEEKWDPEWLYSERVVYSRTNDHIGTADAVAVIGGQPFLVDWKTGSGVYTEHGLQLASYSHALAEELHSEFPKPLPRLIVKLGTDTGKPIDFFEKRIEEKVTGGNVNEDYELYLHLLAAWRRLRFGPGGYQFK